MKRHRLAEPNGNTGITVMTDNASTSLFEEIAFPPCNQRRGAGRVLAFLRTNSIAHTRPMER